MSNKLNALGPSAFGQLANENAKKVAAAGRMLRRAHGDPLEDESPPDMLSILRRLGE